MKTCLVVIIAVLLPYVVLAQDSTRITSFKTYPVIWQQSAAEYRALCYQAFNTAAVRLSEIPKRKFRKHQLAIITDLDETILDNSYAEADLIKAGKQYSSQSWKDWVNLSAATSVPGAVAFLQLAKAKGAHIFYISNRDVSQVNPTLYNLQQLQLPDTDTAHMLFLTDSASKETRRNRVAQKYKVIMLLGDNLNDFTKAFENGSVASRFTETDKVKEEWGRKFIVLPNATYGEWENALYNYRRNLSQPEKDRMLRDILKDTAPFKHSVK